MSLLRKCQAEGSLMLGDTAMAGSLPLGDTAMGVRA